MITEQEARGIVVQLGTAMIEDDKEVREIIYSDLDEESLKRVIRWSVRMQLHFFGQLCVLIGLNPVEAWSRLAMDLYNGDNQEPF